MTTPVHMIIDHINALGPVSKPSLIAWIKAQISEKDAYAILTAATIDGRVYSFEEDGYVWYTTKGQDPR